MRFWLDEWSEGRKTEQSFSTINYLADNNEVMLAYFSPVLSVMVFAQWT